MSRFTFSITIPADSDELYGPDAFNFAIGQPTAVRVGSSEPAPATVVAAEVSDDGRFATVTVELNQMPTILESGPLDLSLGLQPPR